MSKEKAHGLYITFEKSEPVIKNENKETVFNEIKSLDMILDETGIYAHIDRMPKEIYLPVK